MTFALERASTFARGEATIDVLAPKLFASRLTGHIDVAMMSHLLGRLEAWRHDAGGGLVAFHDIEDVSDYDSEARLLITPWSRKHREQFRAVHVLVRRPTVAWGLRVLGALTDGLIVAHHERASFEAARAKAMISPSALAG